MRDRNLSRLFPVVPQETFSVLLHNLAVVWEIALSESRCWQAQESLLTRRNGGRLQEQSCTAFVSEVLDGRPDSLK